MTHHNSKTMLRVSQLSQYDECYFTECHFVECRGAEQTILKAKLEDWIVIQTSRHKGEQIFLKPFLTNFNFGKKNTSGKPYCQMYLKIFYQSVRENLFFCQNLFRERALPSTVFTRLHFLHNFRMGPIRLSVFP
jgi:hypothetical protein